MRWIPYILLVYVVILIQTSLVSVVTLPTPWGLIGPDLAAIAAVFVALRTKLSADAMLAAWALGLGMDLTTAGGPGAATALGPMPIAYALSAWVVFHAREALYRDRPVTQGLVTLGFVLMSHTLWLSAQALQPGGTWEALQTNLFKMLLIGLYSAVLAPLFSYVLSLCEPLVISSALSRSR